MERRKQKKREHRLRNDQNILATEIVPTKNLCKIALSEIYVDTHVFDSMAKWSLGVPGITSSVFHITAVLIQDPDSLIILSNSCLMVFMYCETFFCV